MNLNVQSNVATIGFTTQKLSMAQEARNTERHGRDRNLQVQLRKKPVGFVVANNQDEPSDNDSNPMVKRNEDFVNAPSSLTQTTESEGKNLPAREDDSYKQTINPESSMSDAIEHLAIENVTALRCEQSLSSSSDSDDVVVFQGRGKPLKPTLEGHGYVVKTDAKDKAREEDVEIIQNDPEHDFPADGELHASPSFGRKPRRVEENATILPQQAPLDLPSKQEDVVVEPVKMSETVGKRSERRLNKRQAEEDAILQDYIENMASESPEPNIAPSDSAVKQSYSWDPTDLDDFQDLPTSDEEMESVQCVLARREREKGIQYLVFADDQSPDDARWIAAARLQHVLPMLNDFDYAEVQKLEAAGTDQWSDSDSSDEEKRNDLLDDIESEEDEEKAFRDRVARMTDSQIAITLAKQEELGLPADEVLIYDGAFDDEDDETDESDDELNIDTDDASFRRHRNQSFESNKSRPRRSCRSDGFPSAMAFADALEEDPYGAFDVMDFERPSLKPKSKGRRGQVDMLEIEDEDLKAQIQESWDNDRAKKRAKKLERQQLREMGLLGQKNGRIDMAAKYPHGMQRHHIKAEIKVFLLSPLQRLFPLPRFFHSVLTKILASPFLRCMLS